MRIKIPHIEKDFLIDEFEHEFWKKAREVLIENYWSGEKATSGRHAKVKLLWSNSAFYIRFEANQTEPLVISKTANLKTKTNALWDRDVCEIFAAPNAKESNKYFEFEIAPNGEWIDLKIQQMPDKRETDFNYDSRMESAAKIEIGKVSMAIKINWKAFGKIPRTNDVWKGNLFRCVGSGKTRGYLAWHPTRTKTPNLHVPEASGQFEFV